MKKGIKLKPVFDIINYHFMQYNDEAKSTGNLRGFVTHMSGNLHRWVERELHRMTWVGEAKRFDTEKGIIITGITHHDERLKTSLTAKVIERGSYKEGN